MVDEESGRVVDDDRVVFALSVVRELDRSAVWHFLLKVIDLREVKDRLFTDAARYTVSRKKVTSSSPYFNFTFELGDYLTPFFIRDDSFRSIKD